MVYIPSIKLSKLTKDSSLILLPEIVYKISVDKDVGLDLLSNYRPLFKNNNSILAKASQNSSKSSNPPEFSKAQILDTNSLKKLVKNNTSPKSEPSTEDPWLFIGIVFKVAATSNKKILSVCQIVNIQNDRNGSKMLLSLKSIARGEIISNYDPAALHFVLNANLYFNYISGTAAELVSNRQFLETYNLFVENLNLLFTNINEFQLNYKNGLAVKNYSDTHKLLLRLSPLASIMFSLLNKDAAIKKVNRLYKQIFNNIKVQGQTMIVNGQKYQLGKASSSSATSMKASILNSIIRFYDLVVSLLPMSHTSKYEFLSDLEWKSRINVSGPNILIRLNDVFASFKTNYTFLMKDFVINGDNNEKLKLVINHLTTLKYLMDNINSKKQIASPFDPNASSDSGLSLDESTESYRIFYDKLLNDPEYKISNDGLRLLKKDFQRFFKMSKNQQAKNSAEFQVLTNYLDIVLDLPWKLDLSIYKLIDLKAARKQLDDDHYGLKNVKLRLLEYLAVLNLHLKMKTDKPEEIQEDSTVDFGHLKPQDASPSDATSAPILCFSGPPGVGKTSLAKSIARTLGRKFQRISLGGVSDESEIRGHRRTYVGAMPGVIVNSLRKAKTLNPVILLDEIDKVSSNGATRGDPAAAMLEVLDPEQNSSFNDHYIGFPIDLSQVLFICTANDLSHMHPALLDRMEVIELTGYNYVDKTRILKKFLVPKQSKKNGLPLGSIELTDEAILKIITEYTSSEAGIRNLERKVNTVCRNKALEYADNDKAYNKVIEVEDLPRYLGVPYNYKDYQNLNSKFSSKYGLVNGLSYNSSGTGSTMVFETVAIPSSNPQFTMTGKLGEVLTESIKIAQSFVKLILSRNMISSSVSCEAALELLTTNEIHLHAPEGGVSKDGPSAGIAITLALLSLVLQKPVPNNIAMTGEMTLRGLVLPIGGVKEKLLGAHLSKRISKVLLPRSNRRDVIENYIDGLENDKQDVDDILIKVLHGEQKAMHDCEVYGEPEKFIEKSLGIQIRYVEDFWDVIKAVWGDEVHTKNQLDVIARL